MLYKYKVHALRTEWVGLQVGQGAAQAFYLFLCLQLVKHVSS
jgi:hypothetical protein